jgi:hypothetical protein
MTKTPKRPRDPNQLAKFIVDVAIAEVEDQTPIPMPKEQNARSVAVETGSKGGTAPRLDFARRSAYLNPVTPCASEEDVAPWRTP